MFSEKVFIKRCVEFLRGYYYNDDDEVKKQIWIYSLMSIFPQI